MKIDRSTTNKIYDLIGKIYDTLGNKDLSQKLVDAAEKMMQEASDKQKEYRKFFDGMLKKYGVKSPSELSGDKKKEFFY